MRFPGRSTRPGNDILGAMTRAAGILPAVPTPFVEDRLDTGKLGRLIESLVPTGLAGFLILGSNGEAFSLTDQERREVLQAARRAIPQGKFFLAGCGAESTHLALERIREASDCGANAALVLQPHYLKGSFVEQGYVEHFNRLADHSPIPIYLYHIPQFTGVSLEPETVGKLSRHPNIHGLKDSWGNITWLTRAVSAAEPEFHVLCGSDKVLASAFLMGARGAVLALANVAPEECVKLHGLCAAHRWEEAAQLQARLIPMGSIVTTRFGVPGLKAGLRLLGRDAGEGRLPLLPLSAAQVEEIESTFRSGGLLAGA